MIRMATTYKDILAATEVMKQFEYASTYVKVDIGHAAKIYSDMVDKGIAVYFIMEKDGVIIGGLGAVKCPDLHIGRTLAVETFWFIAPEYRGHGLGLMEAFERWGKSEGCDALAMIHMVDSYPEKLERLYIRRGYQLAEKHYIKELRP